MDYLDATLHFIVNKKKEKIFGYSNSNKRGRRGSVFKIMITVIV